MDQKQLTDAEKKVLRILNDSLYTPEFIEEWINRDNINVFSNAPAALQVMGAMTFHRAVRDFADAVEKRDSDVVALALSILQAELTKEKGPHSYYYLWKSTIATCITETYYSGMSNVHEIADKAAEKFLELLITKGEENHEGLDQKTYY